MTTRVRFALSDSELRAAFALRHQVFVGEQIVGHNNPDGMLFDVFDALPDTRTLVALDGDRVVGTVRFTMPGDYAYPCDSWFAWRRVLPEENTATGSLLCTTPEHRNSGLGLELLNTAMKYGFDRGVLRIFAAVRPQAEPLFARLGWQRVGDPFDHPVERVPTVPMVMGVEEWMETELCDHAFEGAAAADVR